MSSAISESTRTNLFRSIAAVRAAMPALTTGMTASLSRLDGGAQPLPCPETVATLLLNMLLEQVTHLIEEGEVQDISKVGAAHRTCGIDGRHYSGFGDALKPVLKDALGPRLPDSMASAWCDAFWFVVSVVLQGQQPAQGSNLGDAEPRRREIVAVGP